MKRSVLDYGLLDEGKTPQEALQETVALAKKAEEFGYHRFWVAEHHHVHALTISSPEVMMAHLLNQTKTIRIGSGGIMALHYSSLKVAEWVKTLSALFPDRLDIGLGNSLGTPLVHETMHSAYTSAHYEQVLEELQAYLTDKASLKANPSQVSRPPIWLLSMSEKTAHLAGRLGLGYTYGIFPFVPQNPLTMGKEIAMSYRQHFQAQNPTDKPHLILALFVGLAETSQEGENLRKAMSLWFLGKNDFNDFSAFPSLETALAYDLTEQEKETIAEQAQRFFVGTVEEVSKQLSPVLKAIKPDEVLLIPLVPEFDNRVKTLALLTEIDFNDMI